MKSCIKSVKRWFLMLISFLTCEAASPWSGLLILIYLRNAQQMCSQSLLMWEYISTNEMLAIATLSKNTIRVHVKTGSLILTKSSGSPINSTLFIRLWRGTRTGFAFLLLFEVSHNSAIFFFQISNFRSSVLNGLIPPLARAMKNARVVSMNRAEWTAFLFGFALVGPIAT